MTDRPKLDAAGIEEFRQRAWDIMREDDYNDANAICDLALRGLAQREAPQDGIERAREFYNQSSQQYRSLFAAMATFAASEVSRVEAKIERIELSLLELTPSGSEFVNDPERCLEFIKARLSQSVRFAGERNEARKQAEDAKAEVSRVRRETLALLQKHEWDGGRLGVGQCPICSYEAYSHLKNCWLAAAIRKLMDEVG